jgi:hypothetical protein
MEARMADIAKPNPGPTVVDEMKRAAIYETEDEMFQRHDQEFEDVHNGSGLSEEFPSDLKARHWLEHESLLRRSKRSNDLG